MAKKTKAEIDALGQLANEAQKGAQPTQKKGVVIAKGTGCGDITFDNVDAYCGGANMSGLDGELLVAHISEIAAIPDANATSGIVDTDITYVPGPPAGEFKRIPIYLEDDTYECVPLGSETNPAGFKVTLKGFVQKLTPGKTKVFNKLNGMSTITLFQDGNEINRRIVGNKKKGAIWQVKEQTNDKNGYVITITWTSKEPPKWYSGAVTIKA